MQVTAWVGGETLGRRLQPCENRPSGAAGAIIAGRGSG